MNESSLDVSCSPPSPSKPQFARWLIEQVETGQYEGLRYVDQNKIRVPWKHNSRKDCKDEDSKIFRVGVSGAQLFYDWRDKCLLLCLLTVHSLCLLSKTFTTMAIIKC